MIEEKSLNDAMTEEEMYEMDIWDLLDEILRVRIDCWDLRDELECYDEFLDDYPLEDIRDEEDLDEREAIEEKIEEILPKLRRKERKWKKLYRILRDFEPDCAYLDYVKDAEEHCYIYYFGGLVD